MTKPSATGPGSVDEPDRILVNGRTTPAPTLPPAIALLLLGAMAGLWFLLSTQGKAA